MCETCEWESVKEEIDDLIEAETHRWAFDTLDGIRIWMEENKHVTPKQLQAFYNIRREKGRYTGRHYDP